MYATIHKTSTMKKILLFIVPFFTIYVCLGQAEKTVSERRADSVITEKALTGLAVFELSEANKAKITAAVVKAGELRKEAIQRYWKMPQFQEQFNKGLQYQDSVYKAVLGKDKFMQYKTTEMYKRDQWEAAQRVRYGQQKDSITTKPVQHEK